MVVQRRERLDRVKADIESLQAAVSAAKDQLGYTTLEAPFSGVISKRYKDNFQEIRAKETVVSLDDMSFLEILVELPEIVVASLGKESKIGKKSSAHAEFAAAPGEKFALTVKEFATRADPKTQTYQVVLEMERPKEGINILPGMNATVVGDQPSEGPGGGFFIIPAIAVFADNQGASNVWIVDPETMTVQHRKITTGHLTGQNSIQVNEGLKSGEKIAASGVSQLRAGMKVRPFDGTF
jgi:RND family efflux transporter MFP subunit